MFIFSAEIGPTWKAYEDMDWTQAQNGKINNNYIRQKDKCPGGSCNGYLENCKASCINTELCEAVAYYENLKPYDDPEQERYAICDRFTNYGQPFPEPTQAMAPMFQTPYYVYLLERN